MRYRVYDIEDKKERIISECVTPLEVGTTVKVTIKRSEYDDRKVHHFKVLEVLPDAK